MPLPPFADLKSAILPPLPTARAALKSAILLSHRADVKSAILQLPLEALKSATHPPPPTDGKSAMILPPL